LAEISIFVRVDINEFSQQQHYEEIFKLDNLAVNIAHGTKHKFIRIEE
jgi:hypothetical protein